MKTPAIDPVTVEGFKKNISELQKDLNRVRKEAKKFNDATTRRKEGQRQYFHKLKVIEKEVKAQTLADVEKIIDELDKEFVYGSSWVYKFKQKLAELRGVK